MLLDLSDSPNSPAYVEAYTGFWWGKRERDHLEDPGVDGRAILRWIFGKWDVGAWAGSVCIRIGRRWEDNIKMDLQQVGCESMGWIDLPQDRA